MDRRIALGIQIRAMREWRGYSQERLAELARLHRTYIGGVERGERNVSLVNIWRIADALGINPSAFFAPIGDADSSQSRISRGDALSAKPSSKRDSEWTKARKR